MENIVLCAKCNLVPVVKRAVLGTRPWCESCKKASRTGRLERQKEKRRSGEWNSHLSASGDRYPDQFVPTEEICHYCFNPFVRMSKRNGRNVCPDCSEKRKEEFRVKGLENIKTTYKRDPEKYNHRRTVLTCHKMGLGHDWYDKQEKICGICGTDKPGGQGRWCIDHDHHCCGYGTRKGCAKCVRGLLCNACNISLGGFKESPKILRAAIRWLEKKPVKLF